MIIYSREDFVIKCKSNIMKLVSFVEMQLLLYKDFLMPVANRALPHGDTIQSFCVKDIVPYNIFSKCDTMTHTNRL